MWTAATHLLIYTKDTQKSIENMKFELRSSILPQVQSLPKFAFSTYNILPKLGMLFFHHVQNSQNICFYQKLWFFIFSYPERKENKAHDFWVILMIHNKCSMWTAATHLLLYTKNTQKSIENMNFELRSSILPRVQSLPKFTFSTYNISPKLGFFFASRSKFSK